MKVLIVGGTSNIGYSVAKELSMAGHNVYIGVHLQPEIKTLKERIVSDNLCIKVEKIDVENIYDRKKILDIKPDCLFVHNGVCFGGSILEMNMDTIRKNYEVNVFSNFSLIKEFYQLKENDNKKSKVFVTSSISAYFALPFLSSYSSTKAAITNLCKALKYELKYLNPNMFITLIEAGAYHTGFNQIMIDNMEKYSDKGGKVYKNISRINRIYRNLFRLVEKESYNDLVKKIVKEMEKNKPKFRIRRPIIQSILLRIYFVIFS